MVKIPLCLLGGGEKIEKLNDVGGESKSPPGLRNRNESGAPQNCSQESKVEGLKPTIFFLPLSLYVC